MNKKVKASHTLEISIVMPVVLFVIMSLVFLTFYVHDRIVLRLCAYNAGMESVFTKKNLQDTARVKGQALHMFSVTYSDTQTQQQGNVRITYTGEFQVPFAAMDSFLNSTKIKETKSICPMMKIETMYAIKIAVDSREE